MRSNTAIQTGMLNERIIQEILDKANNLTHFYSDRSVLYGDDTGALCIIVERVGRVARQMNELALGNLTPEQYSASVRSELVELAAVSLVFADRRDTR